MTTTECLRRTCVPGVMVPDFTVKLLLNQMYAGPLPTPTIEVPLKFDLIVEVTRHGAFSEHAMGHDELAEAWPHSFEAEADTAKLTWSPSWHGGITRVLSNRASAPGSN